MYEYIKIVFVTKFYCSSYQNQTIKYFSSKFYLPYLCQLLCYSTCKRNTNAYFHSKNSTTCIQTTQIHSENETSGKQKLHSWLNKNLKIEMTDGRVLVGVFVCTDRDGNIILSTCCEYLKPEDCGSMEEPRVLGLVMVPGRHIVSIHLDDISNLTGDVM